MRGGTTSNIRYSTFGGRRGEAGRLLGTDRSGIERWRIDRRAISDEVAKVVAGVAMATVTATATEAKMTTEGEYEDSTATESAARRPLPSPRV